MPSRNRRHLPTWRALTAIAAAALVAGACGTAGPQDSPTRAERASEPTTLREWQPPASADQIPNYEFVAAPDFLNQDVGDVRQLPGWKPGDPNSWTPELQYGIRRFLDEIAARNPGSVLVPGDLVEGRWGIDPAGTGIFGPVRTEAQRVAAVRRAGNFYYSTYTQRFAARGLTLHAAVGDHDVGDNFWAGSAYGDFKRRNLGVFKELFAEHLTRKPSGDPRYSRRPVGTEFADTAYAVYLSPDVLLVSVDEFNRRDGDVHLEVTGGQLEWLRKTLAEARAQGVPWIVVQGHNPILMPVRVSHSSAGHVERGRESALWRTLAEFDVDLYLAGEVHDTTMRQADGVTQISTGGLFYRGEATYLVARVFDDRMELDVRRLTGERSNGKLWQTTGFRTLARTSYADDEPSTSIGSMVLTKDGSALNQAGLLEEYRAD